METLVKYCECEPCRLSPFEPVPFGSCHCRCGGLTRIATRTDRSDGRIMGQPVYFLPNHHASIQYLDPTEYYWPKVDKNGPVVRPELGPCWMWIGYRNKNGYGVIQINGRSRMATHIALDLAGWIIPAKFLQVLHLCDNPPCVRPDHLRIGTKHDDVADKVSKGRQARGERNRHAKLQQQDVADIRRLYVAGGITQRALARRFGVSQGTIGFILRGETWRGSL